MSMAPDQFQWQVFLLRRRAQRDGDGTLWALINDAEALIEGKPTIMPREQVVAAVKREAVDGVG